MAMKKGIKAFKKGIKAFMLTKKQCLHDLMHSS